MAFTDIIKKAFPFISAAASLGGPLGTAAASVVGKALNLDKTPDADGLSDAIAVAMADPTQREALIKAENDFKLEMAKLGFDNAEEMARIAAEDRASARSREIAVKDKIPAILAMLTTTGFFGVLAFMLFRPVPDAGHDALMLMLGSLGTAWAGIVTYYFGSSAGSAAKTDLLAKQAETK